MVRDRTVVGEEGHSTVAATWPVSARIAPPPIPDAPEPALAEVERPAAKAGSPVMWPIALAAVAIAIAAAALL